MEYDMLNNNRSAATADVADGTVDSPPLAASPAAAVSVDSQQTSAQPIDPDVEGLDDLDNVDFDLDEVENKIAPLALASNEAIQWRR
ncbi:lymphostin biosynthesis Trp-donating RiPP [Salinispora pacifica]|uniref:lymphostin biosynthesis Trp-donating RiPP n=1 Tax=Salinispora pacifica TaxID=351187 RepID=UPI00036C06BC|nr:lymphostin biosynthesis Trp-donating RiPP [Salinispora pacifica]